MLAARRGRRRYAGICHIDVSNFNDAESHRIRDVLRIHGVTVSGLGYYPNPLDPDPAHRELVVEPFARK